MFALISAKYASQYHNRRFIIERGIVKWSSAEDCEWTPTRDNDAGDFKLPAEWGMPECIIEKQHEVLLVYKLGIARLHYVGPPFVYQLMLSPTESRLTPISC